MKTDDKTDNAAEGRKAPRKTMRTLGEIVCEGRDQPIECTVLDLSVSGARLRLNLGTRKAFEPVLEISQTFRLLVPRDNIAIDCRLAWREGDLVGAAFKSAFRPLKTGRSGR